VDTDRCVVLAVVSEIFGDVAPEPMDDMIRMLFGRPCLGCAFSSCRRVVVAPADDRLLDINKNSGQ